MKYLFTVFLVCFCVVLNAQTVVWGEDFTSGGSGWTISVTEGTNDAAHNIWIVNTLGPTGSSPSGGNLLHITCSPLDGFCSVMGGPGSVYNAGGITAITTRVLSYSPAINTSGWSNMELSFWYVSRGQMGVDYGTVRYSIDGGTTWTTFPDQFANQSTWTQYSVSLPAACENVSNFRIGFFWQNNNDATGTDPPFCIDDIQIKVPTASSPVADFIVSDNIFCEGTCISFTDQSSGSISSWQWSFPGGTPSSSSLQNPGVICYPSEGLFKAYLTVGDGTTQSTDSVSLQVIAATDAQFSVMPQQGQVPLSVVCTSSAPASECEWNVAGTVYPGVAQINHLFSIPGNYEICLMTLNASGCRDTVCQTVQVWDIVPPDSAFVNVPNVFTPNGDHKNDIFVSTSQNIVSWNTKIFNRWGNVLYESDQANIQWDGTSEGKAVADGVYYYVVNAIAADGSKIEVSGHVTLLR